MNLSISQSQQKTRTLREHGCICFCGTCCGTGLQLVGQGFETGVISRGGVYCLAKVVCALLEFQHRYTLGLSLSQ